MSKTLLSRIKPLHKPEPGSFLRSLFTPHTRKVVNDVVQILRTQDKWEEALETRLAEDDIVVSEIAHFVFDKVRDAELGLKFYYWVSRRPYGCSLDGFAYSSLLKLLAKSKLFSEIEVVLESAKCEEVPLTCQAVSCIIKAYSDTGLVDEALDFYGSFLEIYKSAPNNFAINSLLHALVKCGRVETARRVYDEVVQRGGDGSYLIDDYSTGIMLKGLCKEGKIEEGEELIWDRWGKDCIPNIVFYNTLIDGYLKKGDLERANALFKDLKLKGFLPTLQTYGTMINGSCKEGDFKGIYKLMKEMKARGLVVNAQIYNNIIDARYKYHCADSKVNIIREMIESGCEPDIVTYNTLISGLCKDGKVQEADQLLEEAIKRGLMPNKLSYTPLMHEYARQGEFGRASHLLIQMIERGHEPDLFIYGALVHGLVVVGDIDVALKVRDKMMERGILPDAAIYNDLMSGLCKKGKLPAAKLILSEMLVHKVLPSVFVYSTLIDGFIRNGNLDVAKSLFELMLGKGLDPGIVGYNIMIKGYCKFGMMDEAVLCIKRMEKVGPDEFTYSTIIDGYIKQHDLDGALMMFREMIKRRGKPGVVTCTSLISGFCHKGDLQRAERILRNMPAFGLEPNVVTYTILIGVLCKMGNLDKAVSFFEEMLTKKCIPNSITFNYLVNGFSDSAYAIISNEEIKSQELKKSIFMDLFKNMVSDGQDVRSASYNCILICLCHHRMFIVALQLRNKMMGRGFLCDSVSFAALLHGICLEGKSKEWRNIVTCNLSKQDLQTALRYSLIFDQYLPQGKGSGASVILHTLVEECDSCAL